MPTVKKTTGGRTAPKKRASKNSSKKSSSSPASRKKVSKVMREYKKGTLHSGSEKGPRVRSRKQAIAIALSEAGVSGSSEVKKSKKKSAR